MRPIQTLFFAAATAALAPAVRADFDISPALSGGKIVINAFEDDTESLVNNVHVFDFGFDDAGPPAFTQDPGFHPQAGSGFNTRSNLQVSAASALSYYNGTGPVSFTTVAANTYTLRFQYGTNQTITFGSTTPAGVINFGGTDASGEFDDHLDATLTAPGNGLAADGVYLLALTLKDTTLNPTPSAPFYILYGVNADNSIDAARAYVRDTFAPGTALAPEPASLGLLGVAGVTLLRRRRR